VIVSGANKDKEAKVKNTDIRVPIYSLYSNQRCLCFAPFARYLHLCEVLQYN